MLQASKALSANEAASVTGVPLKQVHRIVDAGLLQGAVETRGGKRVILASGLVGLKFVHETAGLLTPEGRRRLAARLLARPGANAVEEDAVTVDMRPMATAVRRGLNQLEKAKKAVTVDEGVMGGMPCFSGTRIPVHDVAAMLANGDDRSALLQAYPPLTSDLIDLGVVYAEAYPRRGRPQRMAASRKHLLISSERLTPGDRPPAS